MAAEEFTVENMKKMVGQMKNVEFFDKHLSEDAQNIANKIVEADGKLIIEQIYPNAYQQCIGDHDSMISFNKASNRRSSLRALTQTPLKSLGVRVGDAADDAGTKFSVRKAIFGFASSKRKGKKATSKEESCS